MKSRIYITRHGETMWNMEKRFQGLGDSPLTVRGIEQAMKFRERMLEYEIDKIYTSTMRRAYTTAFIIRGNDDIPIEIDENIREMNFGIWEGVEYESAAQLEPKESYDFWNNPQNFESISGESFKDVAKRVADFLNMLITKHKGEEIMVVSHGIIVCTIIMLILNKGIDEIWQHPPIKQTSLTIIEYDYELNKYSLIEKNLTNHL